MNRQPRIGDYVHWEIIWRKRADLWTIIVDDEANYWMGRCLIPSREPSHAWRPGAPVNTPKQGTGSGNCKWRYVAPEDLPDDVLVEITKRALLDE